MPIVSHLTEGKQRSAAFQKPETPANVVPSTAFDTEFQNMGSELNMYQNPARPNPAIAPFQQHPVASNVVPSTSFDTQYRNIGSELNMHQTPTSICSFSTTPSGHQCSFMCIIPQGKSKHWK